MPAASRIARSPTICRPGSPCSARCTGDVFRPPRGGIPQLRISGKDTQRPMAEHDTSDENIRKLGELIQDIRIAMLTTVDDDGTLRSRPMGTLKTPFDG